MAQIWPLHLLILGGFVLFRAALTVSGRPVEGLPLAELPLQVLLIQNWGFTHELAWNHPAWSISTEFAAYLVFPAIVAAGQPIMGRRRLAIAIAALLLAGEYALFTHRVCARWARISPPWGCGAAWSASCWARWPA
jgi:peptidoglycan/LPS O-acetylase OafA/YrhL